jgi:outer membrane protein TolC
LLPLVLAAALGLGGCQSATPWLNSQTPSADIQHTGYEPEKTKPSSTAIEPPRLGPPVIPPALEERSIDLREALELAGIENPTIALAEEEIGASEALWLQARALLLPTLNGGMNVRIHQGTLLGSAGTVRDDNVQSFYIGAGASAKAAETVAIPGVQILTHLGDAIFAPKAAEQQVIARRFDAVAVRNATLLEVGTAYLALVDAAGQIQSLRQSAQDVGTIVAMTANFAETGQGRNSDAQRAHAQWLLVKSQVEQTQERFAVAAANLARLLELDPSVRLVPSDDVPPLLDFVDPATPLPQLLEIAMSGHPELSARSADVATAQVHVRQEHVRPWLPLIMAGFSVGDFGGAGSQAVTRSWLSGARMDADVWAVWSLQNLGLGNRARQNRAQVEVGQADAERQRAVDRIRREVAEALALVLAQRQQINVARRRIETSQKAFEEDLRRARNLVGRPIEVLRSLDLLTTARLDLVRAMVGYSNAQLQLYVALGNTPGK